MPESPERLDAEELFRRHAQFVARLLYRLGVPASSIDDVVQEVFLVAHSKGGYVAGAAKPTTYLASIAVRAASSHRRRDATQMKRRAEAGPDDLPYSGKDAVEVLEAKEEARMLQEALSRLEPALRTTLVLVELEGESCVDVAAALAVPVGTVYWRLHTARRRFRAVVEHMERRPVRAPVRAVTEGRG